MLEIRIACEKDLDNIVKLYVEQFNNTHNYHYKVEPITQDQGRHRWETHLKTKPMLVAYNDNMFLGYCALGNNQDCLNIEYITIKSFMSGIDMYVEFIFAAGRFALGSGYSNMSIIIDGQSTYMKDLCIALKARSDRIYGMMYTYYEMLVWDDLEIFR